MATVVVSLRSRGLVGVSKAKLLDWKTHLINIAHEILDVIISIFLSAFELSWSSWISIIILIIILTIRLKTLEYFYEIVADPFMGWVFVVDVAYKAVDRVGAVDIFLPVAFFVLIPMVVFLLVIIFRRDKAANELGRLKACTVAVCQLLVKSAECGDQRIEEAAASSMTCLFQLVDEVHQYLLHRRGYPRHFFFPYFADSRAGDNAVYKLSHEIGSLLRRVHRSVTATYESVNTLGRLGAPLSEVQSLNDKLTVLHTHLEHLSCIKEMRTPVQLRAVFRWMFVFAIPVMMGFYWRIAQHDLGLGKLYDCLAVLSQVVLCAIMDTLINIEDPFDDKSLETVSLLEVLDHISLMTAPDDESSMADPWLDVTEKGPAPEDHTTVTVEMRPAVPASNGDAGARDGGEGAAGQGGRGEEVGGSPRGGGGDGDRVGQGGGGGDGGGGGGGGGGVRATGYQPEAVISASGARAPPAPPMPPMNSMGAGDF